MARGPLEGVRVLDLTRIWAGPLVGRALGDLGAEVIRIESESGRTPARVPRRGFGIYPEGDSGDEPWNRAGPINKLARNKQSVVLDLKTERGRELFLQLVAESDVVLENFSARVMGGLGLDYAALERANPRILLLSMPGFGAAGPYRDRVAYGPVVEPLSGLAAVLGYGPGEPRATSIALPDAIGGMNGAAAVVTALRHREETGRGVCIDLSQHEACVNGIGEYVVRQQLEGAPPVVGNAHERDAPHGVYRCAGEDAWIAIGCRDDDEWLGLCRVAGLGWEGESAFASASLRREQRAALDERIEKWTRSRDKLELRAALQAAGVPAGALLDAREMCEEPGLRGRGFFVDLEFAGAGTHAYAGSPVQIDGARHEGFRGGSALGADNERVLGGLLGLAADEIEALYASGVIANRPPGAPGARVAPREEPSG